MSRLIQMAKFDLSSFRKICEGISIAEVAKTIKVSRTTLHKLERGEKIRETMLAKILHRLNDRPAFDRGKPIIREALASLVSNGATGFSTARQIIEGLEQIDVDLEIIAQAHAEAEFEPTEDEKFTIEQKAALLELLRKINVRALTIRGQ